MTELQDALKEWDSLDMDEGMEPDATIVKWARRVANLQLEAAGEALRDGKPGVWELLTQAQREIWIFQATLAVDAALGITTKDDG